MTTATRFPETRNPSFSWKKAVKPVKGFFVGIFDTFVEARRHQAAFNIAQQLKLHNRDFRNWTTSELVKHILDEERPVYLDKSPAKGRE